MVFNGNVVNFTYLLIEYYKDLNLDENELAVLLMIDHLIAQDNKFVSTENLAMKMNMPIKDIDRTFAILFKKRLIEIDTTGPVPLTTLKPIKDLVFKKFQETIFTESEIADSEELEESRTIVLDKMEDLFKRSLTPLEVDRVNDWITTGTKRKIILDSIQDAKIQGITNINAIDRLILKRMREEDSFGNDLKR